MPQNAKPYDTPEQDGRRKLMPSDYPKVKALYRQLKSQRQVAKAFNVSRRLIVFILYPERLKALQEAKQKNKTHLLYYSKEKQKLYQRKARAKKRKLGYMIIKTKPRIIL